MTRVTFGCVIAMTLAAAAAAPAAEDQRPAALREIGFDQKLGERLPLDVVLRDERGAPVRLGELFRGRPVVLSLVYYECPMLCTLTLNGLASALDVLSWNAGNEFDVITVSFDAREGHELAAAKKKAYLQRYDRPGAEAGWRFLTGEAASLQRLTQAVGFRYVWDEPTKQFAHASGIVVATPDGVISRYLYGIEYAPKDLRLALIDSGAGKVGTRADQVLLACYRYDPTTGRYGLFVTRLLRAAGVLTLAVLGGFWIVMWRRERGGAA